MTSISSAITSTKSDRFALLAVLSLAWCGIFYETPARAEEDSLPHMDLEMSSEEYWDLVKDMALTESTDPLVTILNIGKRNLEWIAHINTGRPADRKLELSNPALQTGISIDAPSTSSRTIVLTQWDELKALLPDSIKSVLLDGANFSDDAPLADEDFLVLIRKVDRAYQRASRWLLQEPALDRYAERATADVRGFYHLRNQEGLEQKLRGWSGLDAETRATFKIWLIGQCLNADEDRSACETRFTAALQGSGKVWDYFKLYQAAAQDHWNSFFNIPTYRTDITWNPTNPKTLSIPFRTPERPEVLAWLRDNIEDEWKWADWKLKLAFSASTSPNMTYVKFVAGATPNVNRLAGNIITMDANRDINEYSSKWTIRHEYGHVLGFPDCYLEFYDEPAGVMVNYQLDVENLMCSRKGHLQQIHYNELKRAYYDASRR